MREHDDRRRTTPELVALSRWRAMLARSRNPQRRLDLVVAHPHAAALVPRIPVEDFYYLVRSVGLPDAHDVLRLASAEQLQACLDLDLWEGDRLSTPRLLAWLEALTELGPRFAHGTHAAARRRARVARDRSQRPHLRPERPEAPTRETRHGLYGRPTRHSWSSSDRPTPTPPARSSGSSIASIRSIPTSPARCSPMQSGERTPSSRKPAIGGERHGSPTSGSRATTRRSQCIGTWIRAARWCRRMHGNRTIRPTRPCSRYHSPTRCRRVVSRPGSRGGRRRRDGLPTCRRRSSACSTASSWPIASTPGDLDVVRELSARVRDTLSLGLEHAAAGDVGRGRAILAQTGLVELFGVGFSLTLDLARRAKAPRPDQRPLIRPSTAPATTADVPVFARSVSDRRRATVPHGGRPAHRRGVSGGGGEPAARESSMRAGRRGERSHGVRAALPTPASLLARPGSRPRRGSRS